MKQEPEHSVYFINAGEATFIVSYGGEIVQPEKVPDSLRGLLAINPDTLGKKQKLSIHEVGYWRMTYCPPK
jgi:hypothetical protein